MRLQRKIFIMVMGIQILFILLMGLTTTYKTMGTFSSIEQEFFRDKMTMAQDVFDDEMRYLHRIAIDWSEWDRIRTATETGEIKPSDIVSSEMLSVAGVGLLAVTNDDASASALYRVSDDGAIELMSDADTAVFNSAVKKCVALGEDDFSKPDFDFDVKHYRRTCMDFVMLDGSVYMFRNARFHTHQERVLDPKIGIISIGIEVSKVLAKMSQIMGEECSFIPYIPKGEAALAEAPSIENRLVNVDDIDSLFASVKQVRGSVAGTDTDYALSLKLRRSIYSQGKRAITNSYMWMFYNGITLGLLTIYYISRTVLRRVTALRNTVDRVIKETDLGIRSDITRNDEIGDLAGSVNSLLDTFINVLSDIPDPLVVTKQDGSIIFINDETKRLLNMEDFSRDDGLKISDIIVKSSKVDSMFSVPSNGKFFYEGEMAKKDGVTVPVDIHESPLTFAPGVTVNVYLARDLTDRRDLAARIEWNDRHDIYTGLPNRKSFVDTLTRLLKDSSDGDVKPVTLVLINMDHFKSINAEVTNTGGDIVLAVIADRIRNTLGSCGELYRTSGDEFAILFMEDEDGHIISEDDLMKLTNRIRDDISVACQMGDKLVYPCASMGILTNALSFESSSLIIEKATTALKASKRAGIGVITVYREEGAKDDIEFSANVLQMRYKIQDAVKQDQFIPYFQPIYEIRKRRLSGFETLVRWKHPTKGILAPGAFVPYAERIGIISDIDLRMMQSAMNAIANSPAPYYFSANGSPKLMQSPEVADIICSYLDKAGVDTSRFVVEITENVLINNLSGVHRALDMLRERNVRVFLDDFGTGYSSLQYLHSLPFNCIKLDQSFVRRVIGSEQDAKMLHAVINMANTLGMDTIAEGVETEEQLLWLEAAGCMKAQGYYFAKPLPAEQADELIAKEYERRLKEGD